MPPMTDAELLAKHGRPVKTGARPTSRHKLADATPYRPRLRRARARPIVVPSFLEMWLNDTFGNCVTAEEAAAIAFYSTMLGLPEVKITDATVKAFCDKFGFLDGANLTDVMDKMISDGFQQDSGYKDGAYLAVDYSNEGLLQAALEEGPVKIGIDASALPSGAGNGSGWYASGGSPGQFTNEDHCIGIWNHGSASALFAALNTPVPSGFPATGYHIYTWSGVGVVDHPWIMSTVGEAWIRNPTDISFAPAPTPIPPTPGPGPAPTPSWFKQLMDGFLQGILDDFPNSPILDGAVSYLKMLVDSWFSTVDHRAELVIPWAIIISIVTTLLQTLGPLAVPYIENLIAKLNLPPALVAIIDQIIEQFLGHPVVRH